MLKDLFRPVTDKAEQAAHAYVSLLTCGILVLALFAVAHLVSLMYPASNGQANPIAKTITAVCLVGIVVVSAWAVFAIKL